MKKRKVSDYIDELEEMTVPAVGYEILREVLLPDILGKNSYAILYWAGKNIARKFPLSDKNDIPPFFKKMGWGNIVLVKEEKDCLTYELSSDLITNRFANSDQLTFQLEAGFLAETIQQQQKYVTEAAEQQKKKLNKILFTVKWDRLDEVE